MTKKIDVLRAFLQQTETAIRNTKPKNITESFYLYVLSEQHRRLQKIIELLSWWNDQEAIEDIYNVFISYYLVTIDHHLNSNITWNGTLFLDTMDNILSRVSIKPFDPTDTLEFIITYSLASSAGVVIAGLCLYTIHFIPLLILVPTVILSVMTVSMVCNFLYSYLMDCYLLNSLRQLYNQKSFTKEFSKTEHDNNESFAAIPGLTQTYNLSSQTVTLSTSDSRIMFFNANNPDFFTQLDQSYQDTFSHSV